MAAPGIFDKPIVYDGKHIIYSCGKLILANEDNETLNSLFFRITAQLVPNPRQFYVGLPSSLGSGFVLSSPTSQWAVIVTEDGGAIIQPWYDASICHGWASNFPSLLQRG